MTLLSRLHRWTGGLTGLLLAVIALSGTALLWEESWIALPGAEASFHSTTADLARVVAVAQAQRPDLARVTFAGAEIGLHLASYGDGGGAYIDQAGRVVDSWDTDWGRPELWLFNLHHYLLLGESGEFVTGGLGLLLLAFAASGLALWWRTRRTFRLRLWPARMTRSAIVRHHRDLGAIVSPLLIMSGLTGTLMVFAPLSDALLAPWAARGQFPREVPRVASEPGSSTNWRAVLDAGQEAFPEAIPRRLQFPGEPGRPLLLRLRQNFEWTPNGRTYVYLDPDRARVNAVDDPAAGDTAQAIEEKFYPVHAAKVGGIGWKLIMTLAGLALALLGCLATWSFWFRAQSEVGVREPVRRAEGGDLGGRHISKHRRAVASPEKGIEPIP